jgi:hypothetical protein
MPETEMRLRHDLFSVGTYNLLNSDAGIGYITKRVIGSSKNLLYALQCEVPSPLCTLVHINKDIRRFQFQTFLELT